MQLSLRLFNNHATIATTLDINRQTVLLVKVVGVAIPPVQVPLHNVLLRQERALDLKF
jgi:hypothetical protein